MIGTCKNYSLLTPTQAVLFFFVQASALRARSGDKCSTKGLQLSSPSILGIRVCVAEFKVCVGTRSAFAFTVELRCFLRAASAFDHGLHVAAYVKLSFLRSWDLFKMKPPNYSPMTTPIIRYQPYTLIPKPQTLYPKP